MIDLQEIVDESRKLNDLVEDWRQNELQLTCCKSFSADLTNCECLSIDESLSQIDNERLVERKIE